ncbi:MAG TPA: hypothetical protein VFM77_20480, partial [Terriglobales bacterium]|nr:hypothetical protein [Terriglobales bacterium]
QAYLDTLPPKLKTSIENHQALVGMSKEMVIDALGRPPKRIRESDGNLDYEEWIYGEPPGDVQFIRFVNEEVTRVEHSQVGGETTIKTAREVKVNAVTGAATMIDPNAPQTAAAAQPEPTQTAEAKKPPKAPTLRRAGEQPEDQKAAAAMPGELGSKPIPAGGSTQQPEWGTKPAQSGGTTQAGTAQPGTTQNPSSPDAPLPGAGSLPPVDPK